MRYLLTPANHLATWVTAGFELSPLCQANYQSSEECEDWEVIELARIYYNYWHPKETQVILLAESHAFMCKVRGFSLIFPFTLCYCWWYCTITSWKASYIDWVRVGQRHVTRQIHWAKGLCFASLFSIIWGKWIIMWQDDWQIEQGNITILDLTCSMCQMCWVSPVTPTQKQSSSQFATNLLKCRNLPVEERLQAKLSVLENLQSHGIWLLE